MTKSQRTAIVDALTLAAGQFLAPHWASDVARNVATVLMHDPDAVPHVVALDALTHRAKHDTRYQGDGAAFRCDDPHGCAMALERAWALETTGKVVV